MQLFLGKTGSDMGNIDRELEKLICYTMDKSVIEAADVEAIATEQTTNRILRWSMRSRNTTSAGRSICIMTF